MGELLKFEKKESSGVGEEVMSNYHGDNIQTKRGVAILFTCKRCGYGIDEEQASEGELWKHVKFHKQVDERRRRGK